MKDGDGNTQIGLNVIGGGMMLAGVLLNGTDVVSTGVVGLLFIGGFVLMAFNYFLADR